MATIPSWFFVLVVVRKEDRYLLIRERKHGQGWYLPAGKVELGESLEEAAVRETLEESGVPVRIDGILRIQHTPLEDGTRLRLVFSAHPTDETLPKSHPDGESLEARWFSLSEMSGLNLRNPEVTDLIKAAREGSIIAPLELLESETARRK